MNTYFEIDISLIIPTTFNNFKKMRNPQLRATHEKHIALAATQFSTYDNPHVKTEPAFLP